MAHYRLWVVISTDRLMASWFLTKGAVSLFIADFLLWGLSSSRPGEYFLKRFVQLFERQSVGRVRDEYRPWSFIHWFIPQTVTKAWPGPSQSHGAGIPLEPSMGMAGTLEPSMGMAGTQAFGCTVGFSGAFAGSWIRNAIARTQTRTVI